MKQKTVDILPNFSGTKPDCLCFKTGGPNTPGRPEPVFNDTSEHGPSALRQFHERLFLGERFPSRMILQSGHGVDVALAFLLFKRPELVFASQMSSLVNGVDLTVRLGAAGMAHLSPDLRDLIMSVHNIVSQSGNTSKGMLEGLETGSMLFEEHLRIHTAPKSCVSVEDECGPLVWVASGHDLDLAAVYSNGYLGGMWASPTYALVFKKSGLVQEIDLEALTLSLSSGTPELQRAFDKLDAQTTLISNRPLSKGELQTTWEALKGLL